MPLQNDFESSIKNITVDLADSGVPRATLMAMQGDKGTRFARITVLNGGHPVDLTNVYAVLRGVKKDGTTIFNGCQIENNKIIAELTQNILSVDGIGRYEIALYSSDPTAEIKAITYADLNPIVTTNTGFEISQNGDFMTDVSDSTIGTSLFIKVSVNGEPMLIHFYAQESNTDLTLDSIQVRDVLLGLELSNFTNHNIVVNFYKLDTSSKWDEIVPSLSTVLPATVQVVYPIVISNTRKNGELFSNLYTRDGGNVISSFPFTIHVVKSSFDATEMESSNEWTVLNQAMQNLPLMSQLDEYVAEVHEVINNIDDIEGTVGDLNTDVTDVKGRVSTIEGLLDGHSVATSVPANAVFTDTTYSPANANNDGLMTSNQYTKLEGISSGAEVNQNAFSKVTVGSTEVNAATKQDGIKFVAGNNVTITADTSTKEITIASSGSGSTSVAIKVVGDNSVEIAKNFYPVSDESPNNLIISANKVNPFDYVTSSIMEFKQEAKVYGIGSVYDVLMTLEPAKYNYCRYKDDVFNYYYYGTGIEYDPQTDESYVSHYEIWSNNLLGMRISDNHIYYLLDNSGYDYHYEANLSGDYPDAFVYKDGVRLTVNDVNIDMDSTSLITFDPDNPDDINGLHEFLLATDYEMGFHKCVVDFATGMSYDDYLYIPYYYNNLSYWLADHVDQHGNIVKAEYIILGGGTTPSVGDKILVKNFCPMGNKTEVTFDVNGQSETYTEDLLYHITIFCDQEYDTQCFRFTSTSSVYEFKTELNYNVDVNVAYNYVDEAISEIDLSSYATQTYVNNAIQNAVLSAINGSY